MPERKNLARRSATDDVPECDLPKDAETRIHDDHHVSLRLWLRMLSCTNLVERRIRQNLLVEFDTTLSRFELLAQLERVPDGLRMSELSQRLMVTGGNITGLADGLEKEGLIVRVTESTDRRAFRVKLTAEGKQIFARQAREHERWVIDLFARLSVKDKKQLIDLLGQLKKFVQEKTG